MDDLFDKGEPLDGMHSSGRPFRSREELEAENERLREENEMLAELLTGQFEDGSGEIPGGGGEGANPAEPMTSSLHLYHRIVNMLTEFLPSLYQRRRDNLAWLMTGIHEAEHS